ncbi:MAG TPA: hypothetical protein VFW19_18090 [Allosphingosinicella sp.]|nr:hypothetical protein [Allosphingosinicella sp.]
MPSYSDLLTKVLDDTLACQDMTSAEYASRARGQYQPLGPFLGRGYPTTDAALDAVCQIADRFRQNDRTLEVSATRDHWRITVSHAIGANLDDLLRETDPSARWSLLREDLQERAANLGLDVVHYIPVWLFVGQELGAFSIGPVRFVPREEWPDRVAERLGAQPAWRAPLTRLWAGKRLGGGSWMAGAKGLVRALRQRQLTLSNWRNTFQAHSRLTEPQQNSDARSMLRFAHPDQWIACTHVAGFGRDESNRRGLLVTRVALDTVRLILAQQRRHLVSTAADSVVPFSVDGISQILGRDVSRRWHTNRPGVSGSPGLAETLIASSVDLFEAAGRCIDAAANATPSHPCPRLAERWFNACHWFGRACLADVDFTAVVMLVISLDVLCGGLQDKGIVELIGRLHDVPVSQNVLPGMSLKKLVEKMYKLRSEVAHGSILAVHEELDLERSQLESLTATALREYVIKLDAYATAGGADERDAFRDSLPPLKP